MANVDLARKTHTEAAEGKISRDDFATNLLKIETQGIIEQITVAIDLNLQPVNDLSAIKLVQGI